MSTLNDLHQILASALQSVEGTYVVKKWLQSNPSTFNTVIAIGKAAYAMYQGAACDHTIQKGLIITKQDHGPSSVSSTVDVLWGGHPIPTEASLMAGQRLIRFLHATPEQAQFLVLLSGGASSLVEVLADGISLQQLADTNQTLLASGKDISAINEMRTRLSRLKGGGMIPLLGDRRAIVLYISDVPNNDIMVIGSGPFVSSKAPKLDDWQTSETPNAKHSRQIPHHCVAALGDAKIAAKQAAEARGYACYVDWTCFQGNTETLADDFVQQVIQGSAGCYVWGGESTITLPKKPGKGGRNQHMALSAAIALSGVANITLLAAGTDGTDGPGHYAGAWVDGQSLQQATKLGICAEDCRRQAHSQSFHASLGSLLTLGYTGTNVMDLVLAIKDSSG